MHKKPLHEAPDTSKGYDVTDLDISSITKGVIVFFAFAIGVGVVVFIAFMFMGQAGPAATGTIGPRRVPAEPNPLLQNNITARTDIWNLRAREDFMLRNTSWVDQSKGIVRIPIEDAIKRSAQLGPAGNATQAMAPPSGSVKQSEQNLPNGAVPNPEEGLTGASRPGGMPPNTMAGSHSEPPLTNPNQPTKPNSMIMPKGAKLGQ